MNTATLLEEAAQAPIEAAQNFRTSSSSRPIRPRLHGLMDYAQSSMLIAAPTLFGLSDNTAKVTRAFGIIQLVTNLFTDHPVAMKRLIPFRVHGAMEKWTVPAFALLALMGGAKRDRRNLSFIAAQTLLAASLYNLTDWNGDPDQ